MYTIVMRDDKSLTTTVRQKLYQREKLVDKIRFLLPPKYNDYDLSDFTVALVYTDPGNVPHVTVLERDDELYKEHLSYHLKVDTNLNKMAGDIIGHLLITKIDTKDLKQYLLESGEVTITISPLKDLYSYVPDESLDFVSQLLGKVDARLEAQDILAEAYDENKADNIVLDTETEEIYLTAKGNAIGNKISLNSLGDSLAECTDEGLVQVIL